MQGDFPTVNMELQAPSIPVNDIQALLPTIAMSLPAGSSLRAGTAKADLTFTGPVDRLVTAGSVELANAKLSGFSLTSRLAALSAFTGLKASPDTTVQLMKASLRIAPEGIRVEGLHLILPDLRSITGSGTIDSSKSLNFKLVADMAAGGALANLATRVGIGGVSGRGIPFLVQGTTSEPRILPDTGAVIRRGVSGLASPQQETGEGESLGDIFGEIIGGKKNQ